MAYSFRINKSKNNNRIPAFKAARKRDSRYLHPLAFQHNAIEHAQLITPDGHLSIRIIKVTRNQYRMLNTELTPNQYLNDSNTSRRRMHLQPLTTGGRLPIYLLKPPINPFATTPTENQKFINRMDALIINANKMLNLPINWDDDGALPIEKEIFESATSFVKQYLLEIYFAHGIEIQLPEINPCPDGSIDLDWATPNAQLLINIRKDKADNEYVAYYYGDRYNDKTQFKGSFPISEFSESLAIWMKYLK